MFPKESNVPLSSHSHVLGRKVYRVPVFLCKLKRQVNIDYKVSFGNSVKHYSKGRVYCEMTKKTDNLIISRFTVCLLNYARMYSYIQSVSALVSDDD